MRLRHLLRAAALPAALALGVLGTSAVAAAEPSTATGSATVVGTGRLSATGSGAAVIRGTFTISGGMRGGSLVIDGIDRTTAIRVTGWTSRVRVDTDTLLYRGVKGTFTVAGRTIRVAISSPKVHFVAYGTGAAHLRGTGTYTANGHGPFRWGNAWVGL